MHEPAFDPSIFETSLQSFGKEDPPLSPLEIFPLDPLVRGPPDEFREGPLDALGKGPEELGKGKLDALEKAPLGALEKGPPDELRKGPLDALKAAPLFGKDGPAIDPSPDAWEALNESCPWGGCFLADTGNGATTEK